MKTLTLDDLNSYKPVWRRPVIGSYRDTTVLTVPPPSLGGLALVGLLSAMEGFGPDRFRHNSGAYLHLVAEMTKAGTVDLARYPGDVNAGEALLKSVTSRERAFAVRRQISMESAANHVPRTVATEENSGTNHIGVLDGDGNAVSMSLSLGGPFGAKVLVRKAGVILNNQMRKFTLRRGPGESADNAAGAPKPRSRPVNGMTPAILLRDGLPVLVIGTSGGSGAAGAVLQTVLNVLDFRMPVTDAVAAARIHVRLDRPRVVEVEKGVSDEAVAALRGKGHTVLRTGLPAAVQAIRVEGKSITGVSDPRGMGLAGS